jgi:hypothetical protein
MGSGRTRGWRQESWPTAAAIAFCNHLLGSVVFVQHE